MSDASVRTTGSRLAKWRDWTTSIEGDVFWVWFNDTRFEQLEEIAALNPDAPAEDLVDWIRHLLLDAMALGIRRQADLRKDCVSLARLVADVARHPEDFMSAPWYAAVAQPKAGEVLSIGAPEVQEAARADGQLIRELSAVTKATVDKTLAHWATPEERRDLNVDLKAVRTVSARLRSMLNRYRFALIGSMYLSGPVPDYDWLDVFVTPLTTNEVLQTLADRY